MKRRLAAGNWKMNGRAADLDVIRALVAAHSQSPSEIVICPPATLLSRAADLTADSGLAVGAQDCHADRAGAHTGDVSAAMLADCGARYVIVGHSERRADHGERDVDVAAKARAAWEAGLGVIVCVGESLAEREAGRTLDVIGAQLAGSVPEGAEAGRLVLAYEPVWAIGTGKVAGPAEIGEVHAFLRATLKDRMPAADGVRLLYGGSVKGANAAEIFAVPEVDGALVGGASLRAADFSPIVEALDEAG